DGDLELGGQLLEVVQRLSHRSQGEGLFLWVGGALDKLGQDSVTLVDRIEKLARRAGDRDYVGDQVAGVAGLQQRLIVERILALQQSIRVRRGCVGTARRQQQKLVAQQPQRFDFGY